MNHRFREGVYQYETESIEKPDRSVCYQLQLLFGYLQVGKRRYYSPNQLTELLNIKSCVQQDVQEFCNLFLSYLEQRFKKSSNPNVANLIEQEFVGSLTDEVICDACNNVSSTNSSFYELVLQIQGNLSLNESFEQFLAVDHLTEANQYACAKCDCLQNATKKTKITKLPPVLHIQLLRFVFDTKTGHKKKISDEYSFPYTLKLDVENGISATYELSAVLLHIGSSAYGGHYVAHIKPQPSSDQWFKFDDETVTELELCDVGLEKKDTNNTNQNKKDKNTSNECIKSANAYMLIYTSSDIVLDIIMWNLPNMFVILYT